MFSSSDAIIFALSIVLTTETIRFNCFYIVYCIAFLGFLISFFVSLYSLSTLFTEISSSWLIYESIKAWKVKTSIVFNFAFANNSILLYFFLFFLNDLYFWVLAVNAQIFNYIAEPTIPTERPTYVLMYTERPTYVWSKCRNWNTTPDTRKKNKKLFEGI